MIKRIVMFPVAVIRSRLMAGRSNYADKSLKKAIFRTLVAFEIKRVFKSNAVNVKHTILGYTVYGYTYNDLYSLFIEIFVRQIYAFTAKSPNPVIIDCGANIGMSVLYFKMVYPGSKITAFEPNPGAFEILSRNINGNNLADVVLHNKALSDSNTFIDFYISDNPGTVNGSMFTFNEGNKKISIPTEKLSAVLSDKASCDMIKIDVEGAEKEIIKDLVENNQINKAEEYIIEYHHAYDGVFNFSSFLSAFEKNKFSYNIKANFIKKGYRQDILVYFHKLKFTPGNPYEA